VAVYLRMSRDKQEDSPERQRGQILPYCERHGYRVVGEYFDPGIAGDEFTRRPEFQRLLRDAQAGKFAGIVVDHKDRVSRQHPLDYLADVVRPLYRAGVWVETVASGRLDWDSMAGLLTDHIQQHQASAEPAGIAYRTLTALLGKARRGQGAGGPVPYAYVMTYDTVMVEGRTRRVPVKYALGDPLKVEVVRWLYREYATGRWSLGQLRDELHARGVPAPGGAEWWCKSGIVRVLSNRRYLGDWVYNCRHYGKWAAEEGGKVEATGGRRRPPRKNAEEDWVIIPDWHPAIIDRETWAQVQARLQENREHKTPIMGGGDYALNQMLVCGRCGLPMWGYLDAGRRKYRCSGLMRFGKSFCNRNSVSEARVLTAVANKLQAELLNPQVLADLRAKIHEQARQERDPSALNMVRARLGELSAQINQGHSNLALLPADVVPAVLDKVRAWKAEHARLSAELERLTAESAEAAAEKLEGVIATAEELLWGLREAMAAGRPPEVRALLGELVDHVVLDFAPEQRRGNRSGLVGGSIYLKQEGCPVPPAEVDDSSPVRWRYGRRHALARQAAAARAGELAAAFPDAALAWGGPERLNDPAFLREALQRVEAARG
jgi:DNA invertase Pin-like site-specific DNA recombinase